MILDKKMFENVDGWTTDALLYYKLTYEPKGSGELKIKVPPAAILLGSLSVKHAIGG